LQWTLNIVWLSYELFKRQPKKETFPTVGVYLKCFIFIFISDGLMEKAYRNIVWKSFTKAVRFRGNERDRSTKEQFALFPYRARRKNEQASRPLVKQANRVKRKKAGQKVFSAADLHGRVFLPSGARTEIGQVRRRDVVFAAGPFPRWCSSLQHTPPATTTCYKRRAAHSLSLGERGAA